MGDNFSAKIERHKFFSRCIFHGSVLSSAFKPLQDVIDEVLSEEIENNKYFVLDFSQAAMITSTCINVINSRRELMHDSKWDLVIITPKGDNGDIFELTGLSRIYPAYKSIESFLEDKRISPDYS